MRDHNCLCFLTKCACPVPPPPEIYDSPLKQRYRSPLDCFGYPYKCCCCVPLKAGVALICFISFMWALVELVRSEKTMTVIFPDKDILFICAKMIHLFVVTAYLMSCGVLMLGIILENFKAINIYVWLAFIFNCICVIIVLVSFASQLTRSEVLNKRKAMLLTLTIFWHSVFFYYICVVNSYKYRVYGDTAFH